MKNIQGLTEREIFEIIDKKGECLEGDLHIIDQTDPVPEFEGQRNYRIYHNAGYCIDVIKECDKYNEETGRPITWCYDIRQNWPEFATINSDQLLRLLKINLK